MGQAPAETGRMAYFTHEPESHACKGADEWLSVQGSAPPIERNPVKREATAVRRWSFTSCLRMWLGRQNDFVKFGPGLTVILPFPKRGDVPPRPYLYRCL